MKADVWWVVGGALVVLLTVVAGLADRYLCAVYWWPLVGTEWRYERAGVPVDSIPAGHRGFDGFGGPFTATVDPAQIPAYEDDDEWAEQLHVINLDAHRDRPIAQLTHYEVEAVIRDLGVPEWVPQRYRAAA